MFFSLSGNILLLEQSPQGWRTQLSLKPLQNYTFFHISSGICAYTAVVAWEVRKLYRQLGYAELPAAEATLL